MGDVFVTGSIKGAVCRLLSKAGFNGEGTSTSVRLGTYGEQVTQVLSSKQYGLAEEGSLFVATTPTPGTGVALGVATATAIIATAPSLLIYNNDSVGGKNIIMDSIKLVTTAAGTAGTRLDMATYIDSKVLFTSGGTAATPLNANMGVANTSIAKVYDASAAILSPAVSSAVRIVGRSVLRMTIPVVGDQTVIDFGGVTAGGQGILNGSAPLNILVSHAPVVLAPGHSMMVFLWSGSQSAAPTYEYVITWIER